MPRRVNHASNGPGTPPAAFCALMRAKKPDAESPFSSASVPVSEAMSAILISLPLPVPEPVVPDDPVFLVLLDELHAAHLYRVILMERDMAEILASQREMLVRRGAPAAGADDAQMKRHMENHLEKVGAWLAARPNFHVLRCNYGELLRWAKLKNVTITAGELKSAGDPSRDLTPKEQAYFQSLVDNMYTQFVHDVAAGRQRLSRLDDVCRRRECEERLWDMVLALEDDKMQL